MLEVKVFYFVFAVNIHARTFNADLIVCLKNSDGTTIENAKITLTGGSKEVSIKPAKQNGCYTNTQIGFDDSKT